MKKPAKNRVSQRKMLAAAMKLPKGKKRRSILRSLAGEIAGKRGTDNS